jgi:hypothetical protein
MTIQKLLIEEMVQANLAKATGSIKAVGIAEEY